MTTMWSTTRTPNIVSFHSKNSLLGGLQKTFIAVGVASAVVERMRVKNAHYQVRIFDLKTAIDRYQFETQPSRFAPDLDKMLRREEFGYRCFQDYMKDLESRLAIFRRDEKRRRYESSRNHSTVSTEPRYPPTLGV